jgi:RNA polymerase sigma-70 factor (ECF subfamily)
LQRREIDDGSAVGEEQIRSRFDAGDLTGAATVALERYGSEILGFLVALHGHETDASDLFSDFCEQMWKALPRFEWLSSFRTWAYAIARHTSSRFLRSRERRAQHHVPLSAVPEIARVEARIRSQTATHLRSEVSERVSKLRAELSREDQMILVLRVDRRLAWNEIARVTLEGETLSNEEIRRESARLRKRFELIKAKLAELAQPRSRGD